MQLSLDCVAGAVPVDIQRNILLFFDAVSAVKCNIDIGNQIFHFTKDNFKLAFEISNTDDVFKFICVIRIKSNHNLIRK